MIVAVTGASGHIGNNLVRALLQEGSKVTALIHRNERKSLTGLDVHMVTGDVRDPYSLMQAFSGAEVVFHLAAVISLAMNSWTEVEAVNVVGTRNVVETCQKCGVRRLVHFSSIHAMTQTPYDSPVDERRPLVDERGIPPYDRSKAAGELEVRQGIEQGLDAVILNPTGVVGPYDYEPSFFGAALLAIAQGKLPALIDGGFDWVDARDVAGAAIQAEKHAPQGAKYLISGNYASVRELADITHELLGSPVPRLMAPGWLARTGAPALTAFNRLTGGRQLVTTASLHALLTCNHSISHERATRDLAYQPRPLKETLQDTYRWFQEAGLLKLKK